MVRICDDSLLQTKLESALLEIRARNVGNRPKGRYYLIVCEGSKTEPNYFQSICRLLTGGEGDKIVVVGAQAETLRIVERAREEIKKRWRSDNPPFYHVWLVFDRDSFPADDFDNAIQIAADEDARFDPSNGCKPHWNVAWSNEAFELWYLYHFQEVQGGALSRRIFAEMLTRHMGITYRKNDPEMFERLLPNVDKAIGRAKRAESKWPSTTAYHDRNPATTVYKLVEELLRYM